MKLLILITLVTFVSAGSDMFGEKKKAKKWAMEKAFESCYGKDVMRTYMVKHKKAVSKCLGVEAPEIDLPMFKPPMRFVQALMHGVKDKHGEKMDKMMMMMKKMHEKPQTPTMQTMAFVPFPMMQQQKQEDDMSFMKKMMKMMMMKKMMKKMMMMKGKKTPFSDFSSDDDDDDDEDDMSSGYFRNMDDNFGMDKMFEMLLGAEGALKRSKRATDSELMDLGEKLVEKLKMKQEEMKMKMSNMSCMLQEMNIVDEDNNLDLPAMLADMSTYNIKDPWFLKQNEKIHRLCYATAENIPREVLNEFFSPKWLKIKKFMKCCEYMKVKVCMNKDMKEKLEENFKPLKDLVEETGIEENMLLPLTRKLLDDNYDM